jgi:hypothetical protein
MIPFTIPEFKEPTLEEHRATSAVWLKRIGPCLYENWSEALKALSFRTKQVELTRADQDTLWNMFDNCRDERALSDLSHRLDEAMRVFDPAGCFARLSSRSPKDFYFPGVPLLKNGTELTTALLGSLRILDDLTEYRYAETPCFLLLREFHPIPPEQEFRCFIRDRKVVGITQYHYHDLFPQMAAEREQIAVRIQRFLDSSILPVLHLDTVVVDVWLRDDPLLIEINPYGLSDPCLLSYPEMEGNGLPLFRIVESE